MDDEGASSSSASSSSSDSTQDRCDEDVSGIATQTENLLNHIFGPSNLEFEESQSTEYSSSSYFSFTEPSFSANVLVNQPNCSDPTAQMVESCLNFQTFNYPVFKKYGYYLNGEYHSMAKKGTTRQRTKCLYHRGMPKLATIEEEPENEDTKEIQPKCEKKEKKNPSKPSR